MPKRVDVDQVLSYAHRDGEEVRLVLHVTDPSLPEDPVALQLSRRKRHVQVPMTSEKRSGGTILEARVRGRDVQRGVWRLALRGQEPAGSLPLQARLLMSGKQPIALITGPRPRTEMPAPAPRSAAVPPAARLARAARRRLVTLRQSVRSRRAAT
jgi:hypothetical protein